MVREVGDDGKLLPDGEFVADCTDSTPLVRKEIKRINVARPRPGAKRNLPNPTRSY